MSFSKLRAKGGHVVSAVWNGSSVVAPITIVSEAGRDVTLLSPWTGEADSVGKLRPLCVLRVKKEEETQVLKGTSLLNLMTVSEMVRIA